MKWGTYLVETVQVSALAPNPYARDCPTREVLDRVGDRWSVLIIGILGEGSWRFTELHRQIEGISQKMLTQTLRGLERDGLVLRTVHPVVPPRVDYELTALGRTLIEPLHALDTWARAHIVAVLDARESYDAGSVAPRS